MAKSVVQIELKVMVGIKEENGWFISWCPAFDLYTQGHTMEEARENMVEALQLFMESCYERGELERVFKECGFSPDRSPQSEEEDEGMMPLDVPLQLVAARHAEARSY